MIYIEPESINNLFQFITGTFPQTFFMDYEMFNPNDRFGEMMVRNFKLRGIDLKGIHDYPDLKSIEKRYRDCGYGDVEIYDMNTVFNKKSDPKELQRILKLEWLDELEEMNMMMSHYYMILAKSR